MNILMLLDSEFPPDIRVENEAQSLLAAGHSVHILCYSYGSGIANEFWSGIHIHRIPIRKQIAKKMLGLMNQIPLFRSIWIKQVRKIMKGIPFDAVHIHDLPLCSLTEIIQRDFNVKVTADMHENYPYLVAEQPYMNSFPGNFLLSKKVWVTNEKKWLKSADRILCVAEEMKNRLESVLDAPSKISVVPNTLNFNTFIRSQKPNPGLSDRFKNRFIVSFIGGIDSVRGIDYLLEAAGILANQIPELLVLIVGDGRILSELKEKSISMNLGDIVEFEGFKPSSLMQSYIELSDICVIPHVRSEQTDNSSPNKLFQYMYFSKPVVSSNCVSLEKIILKEECGLIFHDRDSNDLAAKINVLYDDPALRNKLGTNGHLAVMEKYNWEATSGPLLSVYAS
jgi:glycosyltransferase involved in cell wall biosynthesis